MILKIFNRTGRIFVLALSLLISLVISWTYGIEGVGKYNYISTSISIFSLIGVFGTNQSVLGFFSKDRIKEAYSVNLKLCTIVLFFVSVFAFSLYSCSLLFAKDSAIIFYTVLVGGIFNTYVVIIKTIKILEDKVHQYYILEGLIYLILIVLLLISIVFFKNSHIFLIIALSYIIYFIITLLISVKRINFLSILNSKIPKEYLTGSLLSIVSTIFLTLAMKVNVYAIQYYYGYEQLGNYSVAMVLVDGIIIFVSSLMVPDLLKLKEIDKVYFRKYLVNYGLIIFGAFMFIFTFGSFVLSKLYKTDEVQLAIVLRIMGVSVPIILVNKLLSNIFIMNNYLKFYLYSAIIFTISLLITNYINHSCIQAILWNYIISASAALVASLVCFKQIKSKVFV